MNVARKIYAQRLNRGIKKKSDKIKEQKTLSNVKDLIRILDGLKALMVFYSPFYFFHFPFETSFIFCDSGSFGIIQNFCRYI